MRISSESVYSDLTTGDGHGGGWRVTSDLIESLPLVQRLALSYAPRKAKGPTLALFALEERLSSILRQRGEVIIAQMKLAWWRDRFAQDPANWPAGEPLLALLRASGIDCARLSPLVDGWETLLADKLDRKAIISFARGRAQAWAAVADAVGQTSANAPVEQAAREWALVDLLLNLDADDEAEMVQEAAQGEPWDKARLPAAVRSLAVLHALARRTHIHGLPELLDGPGAMLLALRVGITGR